MISSTNLDCSIQSLQLLGDFWSLRIIDVLKKEELRYCELQRALIGVNPVTLTNRLKKLEKADLIYRKAEVMDKISVSYSLTSQGKNILPILEQICIFSKSYNIQ